MTLWERYYANVGSACEKEPDAARSLGAQGIADVVRSTHAPTDASQNANIWPKNNAGNQPRYAKPVAGVARNLLLQDSVIHDRQTTADIEQFRVIHEHVLHFFPGSDGNDFLGLDGGDHDVLRENED